MAREVEKSIARAIRIRFVIYSLVFPAFRSSSFLFFFFFVFYRTQRGRAVARGRLCTIYAKITTRGIFFAGSDVVAILLS